MVRPFALSVGGCGLVMVLATCGVDRITNPPLAALSVVPSRLLDSAAVGSLALRADSIKLVNSGTGTLSWTAHRVLGSPWLALSQTSGKAPAEIRVALQPAGLTPGIYRDTVMVSAENAAGSPTLIPVEFVVHPCTVTSIATDAHLTDSVTTADCSAPHRPGSLARLFSLSANAGDSISIIMSSTALDGHVVLASSTAGTIPPLAEADSCDRGPARAACLGYQLLATSGTFVIEATSSSSTPQTGVFTLSVTRPHPPNTPDLLMQLRADSISEVPAGGGVQDAVVVLRGTVSDPDSDSLRLEVEAQPVRVPFTNTPTGSSLPVSSGGVAVARIADLGDSTSYHWQARTVDQTGRASAWLPFDGDQADADFRVAVAATELVFTIEPTQDTAGAALAPAVQVAARDTTGHTTIAFAGAITVAIGANSGDATLSGTTTVAATGGVATFSDLSVDKAGSGYTLTASSPGLRSATSPPFTVEPGPARNLTIATGNDQAATVNSSVPTPPAVLVRDQFDNPVDGVLVTFAVTSGGGAVTPTTAIPTNAGGLAALTSWTLGTSAGPNTLTATAAGLTGVTFTTSATTAAATHLTIIAGNDQTATVNTVVPTPPSVLVRDQFDNPVDGVLVTFALTSGAGAVTPTTAVATNAGGIATLTSWTLGTTAGTNTLIATATGLTGVTFTATGTADAATQLTIHAGDTQSAIVATALSTPPAVLVRDQFDNPVAGVAVAFAVASGGGSISVGNVTTDAPGIAAVGSWTLGTAAGPNTLTATATGLTGVTFTATAIAGAATQLTIHAGDTQTATVATALPTPPAVVVRDQFDNPVAGVLVTFAVTSGGGAVTPATAVATNTSGIAAPASWTLGTAAGPNTLSATATGLTGVEFTATGTAAAPNADQSLVEASPTQTIASAGASASTVTVTVRDAFGNSVRGATVTLAASGTANTLAQQSDTTNASGQVTGTLSSTRAELKTISATVNGTVLVTQTATVTVTSAAAAALAIDAGDNQTAAAGTAVAIPPSVLVTDAFGNPVTSVPVTFFVTAGGGTRTPTTPVTTNAGGIAMLTAWTLGTHISTNTLAAMVDGLDSRRVSFRATVPPPPGPVPDPTRLPVAAGQAPDVTAYAALNVANQPAGFSYNDPVTGVKVWKVTSDVVPAENSGAGHDYGDGGNQVSQGWGPDNNTYTILVRPELADAAHLYYVVDFTRGVGFSNYRLLTVQPREDLSATFSSLPNQPHILYLCTGSELVRYNTATMQVENTGNFPLEVDGTSWLHQDHDDIWFTGLLADNQTVWAWNSQTNQYLTHFEIWTNEPRLERDGRFLVLTAGGQGPIRVWDLLNNAFGPTQTTGVEIYFSHLASLRSGWVAGNPNGSAPFAQDRYEVSGGQIVKTTILNQSAGAEVNNSGNWVQSDDELGGDLTRQWAVVSGIDEVPWSSPLLWDRAVGLERADGSDQRLLLHHYDVNPLNTTGYFSTPWGHPSPDGKVVIFNSNMNGSVRYDLFVAEVPLR